MTATTAASGSFAAPPGALYTRAGYRALLAGLGNAGWRCIPYDGAEPAPDDSGARLLLLRHDVDADPGAALEQARDEAAAGARATYFVMLHSPVYNAFSRAVAGELAEIAALGHWVGLHYDAAVAPPAGRSHPEQVATEAQMLSSLAGVEVRSFSFHQPRHCQVDPGTIRPAGLASAWNVPGFEMLTDANKRLDHATLAAALGEGGPRCLQLLVHPEWWTGDDPDAPTADLWDAALSRTFDRMQEQLLACEGGYGPPRTLALQRLPREA